MCLDDVLLEKRLKQPGRGLKVLPGGLVDNELPEDAMKRELREELGLVWRPREYTLIPFYHEAVVEDGTTTFMLYYKMRLSQTQPLFNREPEKCAGFVWEFQRALNRDRMWASDYRAVRAAFNGVEDI
jgi:ADP-ribose pyrophosphatase YjhB (NUDIX family)